MPLPFCTHIANLTSPQLSLKPQSLDTAVKSRRYISIRLHSWLFKSPLLVVTPRKGVSTTASASANLFLMRQDWHHATFNTVYGPSDGFLALLQAMRSNPCPFIPETPIDCPKNTIETKYQTRL